MRGQAKIGQAVGAVIDRRKVAKHFVITITDDNLAFARDADAIEAEARLDGIYVLRTSVPGRTLDTAGVVTTYKSLARAERAFRSLNSQKAKVRTIGEKSLCRARSPASDFPIVR